MVEALARRVETVDQRIAGEVAGLVVAGVAVVEAVGHDEVEDVVLRVDTHWRLDEQLVAGFGGAAAGVDSDVVGGGVVAEGDRVAVDRREADVAGGMTGVPGFVERDLELVVAGRDLVGAELVHTVAVGVLQPGPQAVGLPVARATELGLEAAGRGGDRGVDVVGDPVGLVVVVELHVGCRATLSARLAPG